MEEVAVTLENLDQFSDERLKQLFEQKKLDVQKLFDLLAKKFIIASIMQMDSASLSLEQKTTRLLTVSAMEMTQQEDLLRLAVFFWSDVQTRALENKLWNFCINSALKKRPHRKQAILDSTLVKLAALYMKDRNGYMFNAVYTAMEKLIAESMLPAEILFMIARNSINYAETVSTMMQQENRRLEQEVRSGYAGYWSERRAHAPAVQFPISRDGDPGKGPRK